MEMSFNQSVLYQGEMSVVLAEVAREYYIFFRQNTLVHTIFLDIHLF